mmetsp:Transcript_7849/g.13855  ORF Transcript_7849/g.13855 Transcript_7849/m.13855 type:complete len:280 (-) Transcript_7849:1235-2074(-)
MQCSKMCLPTCASTALSGSSKSTTSGFAYTARARLIRDFWPPETFTPRSPISVRSDAGRMARSETRAQASSTALYRAASKGASNKIFSRTVRFMMNGSWVHNARFPRQVIFPDRASMSPISDDIKDDLPEAMLPTTATSSPFLISKFRSSNRKASFSVFVPSATFKVQVNDEFRMLMATSFSSSSYSTELSSPSAGFSETTDAVVRDSGNFPEVTPSIAPWLARSVDKAKKSVKRFPLTRAFESMLMAIGMTLNGPRIITKALTTEKASAGVISFPSLI